MEDPIERQPSFTDMWPLLALQYGLISAGVLAWLWEIESGAGAAMGALLLSLMLLLELPATRVGHVTGHSWWLLTQFALGVGAFALQPGLAAGVILCGVLCGLAARTVWWVVLACLALVILSSIYLLEATVGTFIVLGSFYALSVATGRLFHHRLQEMTKHATMVDELEAAHGRIAEFAETTRALAATNARQRLAEELHDSLGHALVGTLLQVQLVRKMLLTEPSVARDRLALVEESVRETLESVRQALRQGTSDRGKLPLPLALETLVADFSVTGGPQIDLTFIPDSEHASDVSQPVATALYRTAQEAFTNAVRHGQARRIRVEVEAADRRLYLRITDDGVGASQFTPGMGLTGMVSRVQAVGGTLKFQTAPGSGFQIEVGVMRR